MKIELTIRKSYDRTYTHNNIHSYTDEKYTDSLFYFLSNNNNIRAITAHVCLSIILIQALRV